MGIKDLAKVISDHAPAAIKENDIKNYFGRKIAIDASMSIYQFLIAVRQDGSNLTNDSGETTSHLMGMFYRTIRMVDNGIKPLYVFDGKAPQLKANELAKRQTRRDDAEKEHEKAVEMGDTEAIDKFSRRLVRVTREHNDECKKLLRLMGIPYVDAPCEAEAQCAALVKASKVYATATEDMDGLTFGSKILLRHMTFSEAKKMPIKEFHLERILTDFGMSHEQFVDLCILLGCDYCGSIKGIGPKKAFDLIKQHKSIENVLKAIDTKKYPPPDDWSLEEVRKLFLQPEVLDAKDIEFAWNDPDEEALIQYMVREKNFSEERIRNGASKLKKGRNSVMQGRIDTFFTISPAASQKRKAVEEEAKTKTAKKSTVKTGGRGKKK